MVVAARTTRTGVSSQRPFPCRWRRICTNIQTASASIAGGHTQLRSVKVAFCGEPTISPTPETPMTTAGTVVQRWGWAVNRTDSAAIIAQPMPKALRIEPVMTLSVPPGKTTRVSTRAVTIPAASEPAITRATGTRSAHRRRRLRVAGLGGMGVDVHGGLALAVMGDALLPSVAVNGVAHPGQMAGMLGCACGCVC